MISRQSAIICDRLISPI